MMGKPITFGTFASSIELDSREPTAYAANATNHLLCFPIRGAAVFPQSCTGRMHESN